MFPKDLFFSNILMVPAYHDTNTLTRLFPLLFTGRKGSFLEEISTKGWNPYWIDLKGMS